VRALAPRDLAAVVAIDAALGGRVRRAYFERRLQAAQRDPAQHLQLAVEEDGALAGFILGRALEGEFGRSEPGLRLEALGVKAAAQGRGLGAALAEAFEDAARRRGLGEIRTAARWREHELLAFLDRSDTASRRCTCWTARPAATTSRRRAMRSRCGLSRWRKSRASPASTGASPGATAAAISAARCARRLPIPQSGFRSPPAWTARWQAT
jgi:GNAT superfamily N-acetyltransferase